MMVLNVNISIQVSRANWESNVVWIFIVALKLLLRKAVSTVVAINNMAKYLFAHIFTQSRYAHSITSFINLLGKKKKFILISILN